MTENNLVTNVFRASFEVTWPISGGGYPDQQEALDTLAQNEASLRSAVEERMRQLLDIGFELVSFHYQVSGRSDLPNSISLLIDVKAPGTVLRHGESLDIEVSPATAPLRPVAATRGVRGQAREVAQADTSGARADSRRRPFAGVD